MAACVPLRASVRASSRFASSSVPVVHVPMPSHCFSSLRPASSTRRTGRHDSVAAVLSALLACPSARHLIRAVRHRMATGFCACLVRLLLPACLPACLPRPMAIIGAACYLSDFLTVLSPHRLIAPITRHGGRGGASWSWLLACAIRSLLMFDFACGPFVRVLWRMASGVALLAWLLYIYLCRWGDGISATVRVRPLIAWTRPLTRFLLSVPRFDA